jgi:hypothetical protein
VVDGGDNVEFELAVRRGLEDARVDFDLFDARAVELFERGDDAGLLAGAGGSVDEEVGEVAALGLDVVSECTEDECGSDLREPGDARRALGGNSESRVCADDVCLRVET